VVAVLLDVVGGRQREVLLLVDLLREHRVPVLPPALAPCSPSGSCGQSIPPDSSGPGIVITESRTASVSTRDGVDTSSDVDALDGSVALDDDSAGDSVCSVLVIDEASLTRRVIEL